MKKALTYDDVNIVPKYSELESRGAVKLNTRFTKKTLLNIPIVSSPMDTITELDMAREMMEWGGVGVVHRFMSIEDQAEMMVRLCYMIGSDHVLLKNDLPKCASVGVTGDYLERSQELVKSGCNVLLIDVAHGHHKLVGEAIEKIKTRLENIEVIAGSVATGEACEYLCEKGADAIRIGIGNGSLCETRIRTGVGIPQVTALLDCVAVADSYGCPTIADGGIRNVGDVCKGLACGADSVMLGSLLSGTKETPGTIEKIGEWPNEQLYKKYRGSASLDSKHDRGDDKNVEGNHKVIQYKGKVKRIIQDIQEGIRSSFSYVGANDISEFHSKIELIEITRAGNLEGKPHLLNS
ncbi:guanosine monophosphate reductase [Candidatus Woesearchaeota archaeon]|jgi:IMP dehydrogenase|nr:guanosine monophosphate reductase [Candidatus Woesearchaeota archaeon]